MEGNAPPAATAALLTALRVKGESVPEIVGFARAMRRFAAKVDAPEGVVDTCGTGGDAKGTINISTAAAFVARGAGVVVAKHGNRAATSRAGSADVLEALGAEIELGPEKGLPLHRRGRHRVHVRPHPPPRDEVRGPRAGGAAFQDRLQPARAADQPRGGQAPARRGLRRGLRASRRRGAAGPRGRESARRPRHGRDG